MTLPDRCKKCFAVLPPNAKFCPRCGEPVPQSETVARNGLQICPACKHENPASAVFCESCGARLRESVPAAVESAGQVPAPDSAPSAAPSETVQADQAQPAPAGETQSPPAATGYVTIGMISQPPASTPQPPPAGPAQRPQAYSEDPWAVRPAAPSYRPMMDDTYCPRCGNFNPAGTTECTNCGLPFAPITHTGVPFEVARQGVPAGFWVRFVAFIVDNIVVFAIGAALWPILFQETFWVYERTETATGSSISWRTQNWQYLISFCYSVFFLALWGATPGKMMLNIRVLNEKGQHRIGFVRAIIRTLATFLSGVILLIGYIMVAFRRDKRALHDLIAGTYPTIRTRR